MKIFLSLFLLTFFYTISADTKVEPKTIVVNTEVSNTITVSDIPQHATQISLTLKDIQTELESQKELTILIDTEIPPYLSSITQLLDSTKYKTLSAQNTRELQKMQSELSVLIKQLQTWAKLLSTNIDIYDKNKEELKKHTQLWNETQIHAVKENAPEAILTNIDSVVQNIKETTEKVKEKYDKVLTSSQALSTNILTLEDIYTDLKKNEDLAKNKIFLQNQAPLTEILLNDLNFLTYIKSIHKTILEKYNESIAFFITNSDLLIYFLILNFLSLLFVIYFNFLYHKQRLFICKDSINKKEFYFIKKPFSTFFLLLILSIILIFSNRPSAVIELQLVFILIPTIRILQTVLEKNFHKFVYIFFIMYIMFIIDKNSMWVDYELESRVLLLFINLSLLSYLILTIKNKILLKIKSNTITKLGTKILYIYSFLLIIALFSNFYGLVSLSSRIIDGVLSTLYASVIFYTLYIILTGYVVVILRRRISSASNMLDIYAKNIEKYTRILMQIFMLGWWLVIVLKTLAIYPYLIISKKYILSISWNIAQTEISVHSIFDFLTIVVGTWIIARLVNIILEVEVFARFKFPRGFPTAVLTTLNYIIVISGTILAFSSLGVTPQQFALIFGALGVGIGFGLRNIIANFVSGIIMVFERPVQLGDTIEVGGTIGSVQSIGARSSTIKTFDGSEVIIPNADFIAKEIVNWTLSDEQRRKVIEFKVDLNNDVNFILEKMTEIAIAHPSTLKDPKPIATLKNIGEYYLEFKLYFWLSENLILAPSEITITLHEELKKAGVKRPVRKHMYSDLESLN